MEGTVEMYVGADPNINPNTKRGTRTPRAVVRTQNRNNRNVQLKPEEMKRPT